MSSKDISLLSCSFCFIDKPAGMTSMQAIKHLKRNMKPFLPEKFALKAGHTGTLDPFATGVLPICIGETTKLADLFHLEKKSYQFEMIFGEKKDSGDITGNTVQTTFHIPSQSEIEAILPTFLGDQMQKPHPFSAVHVNGVRSYHLARAGKEVELEAKPIKIFQLSLLSFQSNKASLSVECSSGTYVRSLANDIASKLGSLGYVSQLDRTSYGNISKADLCTLDNPILMPAKKALDILGSSIPLIECTPKQAKDLLRGLEIEAIDSTIHITGTAIAIIKQDIVGIVTIDEKISPKRMFNQHVVD